MEPYIKCRSGRKFDYVNPTPEMVHVYDVAHAAGMICRFNGHTRDFFSIAQHMFESSVLSFHKTHGLPEKRRQVLAYACLMHDAHEAYVGDWPSPLKIVLPEFRVVERRVLEAVETAFGTQHMMADPEILAHVKEVDLELLWSDAIRWGMDMTVTIDDIEYADARDWVPADAPIHFQHAKPLPPREASKLWMEAFRACGGANFSQYTAIKDGDFRLVA